MKIRYRKQLMAGLLCAAVSLVMIQPVVWAKEKAPKAAYSSQEMTPDLAKKRLVEGNKRFVADKTAKTDLSAKRRMDLDKNGQHPFVTVLSCADSRVPPEHVFNQGLGDIFALRVAGNILVPVITGSIEFAQSFDVPLIVVMGHDSCGAVQATVEGAKVGDNIAAIAQEIVPAFQAVKAGKSAFTKESLQENVTSENVAMMVARLKENPDLKPRIAAGKLQVIGAKYYLATGKVVFFD